jgi:predicted Holliday junction resolvase-like endonuclease
MTGLEIVLALLLLVAVLFAVGYYLESNTVNQLRHDERLAAASASSETISREQLAKDYILKHEHKQMLAAAREDAITNSRAVNKGFVYEEMAPHWQKGFDPKDFHHMGAPIDYLIIDGANDFLEGRADNIRGVVLFEVKTGNARMSKIQRLVRDAVKEGRVRFIVSHIDSGKEVVTQAKPPERVDELVDSPSVIGTDTVTPSLLLSGASYATELSNCTDHYTDHSSSCGDYSSSCDAGSSSSGSCD